MEVFCWVDGVSPTKMAPNLTAGLEALTYWKNSGRPRITWSTDSAGSSQDWSQHVSCQFNNYQNIAQNAYCSRDIYFQFNKVCRSVISCVDAMKAPQRLVALNALGCSLIWCRWQTKQRGQFAIFIWRVIRVKINNANFSLPLLSNCNSCGMINC